MTPDDWRIKIHSVDSELIEKFDRLDTLSSEQLFAIKYFYILYQKLKIRERSVNFLYRWIRGLEIEHFYLESKFKSVLSKLTNEEREIFHLSKKLNSLKIE